MLYKSGLKVIML